MIVPPIKSKGKKMYPNLITSQITVVFRNRCEIRLFNYVYDEKNGKIGKLSFSSNGFICNFDAEIIL